MHSFEVRQWAFTLSDEPDAWAKGFDDSSWRAVTVPHVRAVEIDVGHSRALHLMVAVCLEGPASARIGWFCR